MHQTQICSLNIISYFKQEQILSIFLSRTTCKTCSEYKLVKLRVFFRFSLNYFCNFSITCHCLIPFSLYYHSYNFKFHHELHFCTNETQKTISSVKQKQNNNNDNEIVQCCYQKQPLRDSEMFWKNIRARAMYFLACG